jgi:fructokinase
VIGEALVDLVPDGPAAVYRAHSGGSPFNVAVGLARLQNPTSLMARLGDHGFGRTLRDAAAAEGIDLGAAPDAPEPATLAVVSLDDDGHATYEFYLQGTADWQWSATELSRLPADAEVLHFGSIAAWTPPGNERIDAFIRDVRATRDVLVSYDPNIRASVIGERALARELVERSVGSAHVVKASREDLEWLYPGRPVEESAAEWSAAGPVLVVITDGAHGAAAYRDGREPQHQRGRAVSLVDTIGAGDAFTAGMLNGLVRRGLQAPASVAELSDAKLGKVLEEAVLISSVTCERAGADPPRVRSTSDDIAVLTRTDLI